MEEIAELDANEPRRKRRFGFFWLSATPKPVEDGELWYLARQNPRRRKAWTTAAAACVLGLATMAVIANTLEVGQSVARSNDGANALAGANDPSDKANGAGQNQPDQSASGNATAGGSGEAPVWPQPFGGGQSPSESGGEVTAGDQSGGTSETPGGQARSLSEGPQEDGTDTTPLPAVVLGSGASTSDDSSGGDTQATNTNTGQSGGTTGQQTAAAPSGSSGGSAGSAGSGGGGNALGGPALGGTEQQAGTEVVNTDTLRITSPTTNDVLLINRGTVIIEETGSLRSEQAAQGGQQPSFRQEAGQLVVNGSLQADTNTFQGGTVSGSGTISGQTGNGQDQIDFHGGTIDFTDPNVLTFHGHLVVHSPETTLNGSNRGLDLNYVLAGFDAGVGYGQLNVTGEFVFDDILGTTVSFADGFTSVDGGFFDLIVADSFRQTGNKSLMEAFNFDFSGASGFDWTVSLFDLENGRQSLRITSHQLAAMVAAVPLPAGLTLLLAGIGSFALLRRRRTPVA